MIFRLLPCQSTIVHIWASAFIKIELSSPAIKKVENK